MEDSHVQQYEIRQSSFCLVEKDEIGWKLVGQNCHPDGRDLLTFNSSLSMSYK